MLNISPNICIKPTTSDIHLCIINAFVTYYIFVFGAKYIGYFVRIISPFRVGYCILMIVDLIMYNI